MGKGIPGIVELTETYKLCDECKRNPVAILNVSLWTNEKDFELLGRGELQLCRSHVYALAKVLKITDYEGRVGTRFKLPEDIKDKRTLEDFK